LSGFGAFTVPTFGQKVNLILPAVHEWHWQGRYGQKGWNRTKMAGTLSKTEIGNHNLCIHLWHNALDS
jgi:hypothetical protein